MAAPSRACSFLLHGRLAVFLGGASTRRLLQTRGLSKRIMGQPSSLSHPSIIKEGEVVPGVTKIEFAERRRKLMMEISNTDSGMRQPNHIVLVPTSPTKYRYGIIPFKYYQNPDLLYLSGFKEPEGVLVLESTESTRLPAHKSILYVPARDQHKELWDGPSTGPDDVTDLTGVDEAYPLEQLEEDLTEKYGKHGFVVWYCGSDVVNPALQERIARALQSGPDTNIASVHNFRPHLDAVRVVKSPAEVELMRTACDISAHAFKETMKMTAPDVWEYQLESTMEHAAIMRGAYSLSFPPVVGGGERGCHIHYISNNNLLKEGELVLMDAGVDYHGYVSDITRTWPTTGEFSSAQEELYGSLLELQNSVIQQCKVGMTLNYLHRKSALKMADLLVNLKIVSSRLVNSQLHQAVESLYPHHVSHYLGQEVHDSPSFSRNAQLQPGMVITVEPGIYIPSSFVDSPLAGANAKHFAGLAVRIEDDLLITASGNEVLSAGTPKDIAELTRLASSGAA